MNKRLKLIIAYTVYLAIIAMLVGGALSIKHKLKGSVVPEINSGAVTQEQATTFRRNLNKPSLKYKFNNDGNKYVILTFDDGWSSQYEAIKRIYPWKGTLYISSALIGQKERLTLDNLAELYRNGWDISNHTANHLNLTKLSLKQASAEVAECSTWIANQGFTRDRAYMHFAYPEGGYNDQIISILSQQGMLTARTTNAGNDTKDSLLIGRTSLYGMTPSNIRANIMSDQKLLILSFHRIVNDSSTENKEIDLKESYFQEVIKAIHDSNRKVITMTEWYKMGDRLP